jgi:hypothetical protein
MGGQDISAERRQVISAMRSLGWTATREDKPKGRHVWKFTRPDTGGLWDLIRVRQDVISWRWMRGHMLFNEDGQDFAEAVEGLWQTYFQARFRKSIEENP